MKTFTRISEAASLAIHTTVILAAESDRLMSTRDLAQHLGVSANHLAKVLQRLERAGYVDSVRGRTGGFQLSPLGRNATLLDIYEAIEGPFEVAGCLLDREHCLAEDCPFGKLLHRVTNEVYEFLAKTRPADLARSSQTA